MPGPLAGIRVIEFPAIGPVPLLGMLLSDLGAEMVRIDKLPGARSGLGGAMASGPLGRARRSLGLDLRRPGAAEVVLRLAARSDALIEGFRPGVAERLGVGPTELLSRNPALVYGRMTGWGQDGPLATPAGHDIAYLAISGLLHGIGPAHGPSVPPINYVADFVAIHASPRRARYETVRRVGGRFAPAASQALGAGQRDPDFRPERTVVLGVADPAGHRRRQVGDVIGSSLPTAPRSTAR